MKEIQHRKDDRRYHKEKALITKHRYTFAYFNKNQAHFRADSTLPIIILKKNRLEIKNEKLLI